MPEKSKSYLFIVNNAPYGDERPYNALRLAYNLVKREGTQVSMFLTADGVFCARQVSVIRYPCKRSLVCPGIRQILIGSKTGTEKELSWSYRQENSKQVNTY